jgi:hypothetical protein
MNRRQERLSRACAALGLKIALDWSVTFPSGRLLAATALIPEFGAPKGMIIIDSFDKVSGLLDELDAHGYGFSVLAEPSEHSKFDLDSTIEMFADWGWASAERLPPDWMTKAQRERPEFRLSAD